MSCKRLFAEHDVWRLFLIPHVLANHPIYRTRLSCGGASPRLALAPQEELASLDDRATLQKIMEMEESRTVGDRFLVASLSHPSPRVVRAALLAIAHNQDRGALEEVSNLLNKKNPELKKLAAFTLGQLGDSVSLKILSQHVQMQKDPQIVAAVLLAVGKAGGEAQVPLLASQLSDKAREDVLDASCQALGSLWSGNSESWAVPEGLLSRLFQLAGGHEPVARSAAYALSRFKGDMGKSFSTWATSSATLAFNPATRALLCRVLGRVKGESAVAFLSRELSSSTNQGVRVEAAKALAEMPLTDVSNLAFKEALKSESSHVVFTALESIAKVGDASFKDVVDTMAKSSSSCWLRGTAMKTLAKLDAGKARERVGEVLTITNSPLLPYALRALGTIGKSEDMEKIGPFVLNPDLQIAEAAIESLTLGGIDKISDATKKHILSSLDKADTGLVSLIAQLAEKAEWKDFTGPLTAVYARLKSPDQVEPKVAVLSTLGALGNVSQVAFLEKALGDPDRVVATAAATAIQKITKKESPPQPTSGRMPPTKTPPYAEAIAATTQRLLIKTSRGEIGMKLDNTTPLTAYRFTQLVKNKLYKGTTFHRVVPNFVVQGGDPRGDGFGGPGYFIRDELSWFPHERGTVGIATAGPDTGGSQFFINLAPNNHLDRTYTLFAEITSGMDVADRIEPGDRILSIELR